MRAFVGKTDEGRFVSLAKMMGGLDCSPIHKQAGEVFLVGFCPGGFCPGGVSSSSHISYLLYRNI